MIKLIISLIIPLSIGAAGSLATSSAIDDWYQQLNKPTLTPPNWLFAPVWTILYFMMGLSFYLIWRLKKGRQKNELILLFLGQLILNGIWSPIFFGLNSLLGGLIVIFPLVILVSWLIIKLWKINKFAALLLIPYLIWVSYASYLNSMLWMLNN